MRTTNEAGNSSPMVKEGTALPEMRRDDEFFCSLVDCIPARYYFDQDTAKEIRDNILRKTDDVFSKWTPLGAIIVDWKQVFELVCVLECQKMYIAKGILCIYSMFSLMTVRTERVKLPAA